MKPATHPVIASRDARLLVVSAGVLSHRPRADFPALLRDGDLVVANDAAAIPGSLSGTHVATGVPIEVRLAGRPSLDPGTARFTAIVFGGGDYHTPTEQRIVPPVLARGDELRFDAPQADLKVGLYQELRAHVVRTLEHPRLIELDFDGTPESIWPALVRIGRPIQYAYVPAPLAIWDTWTRIAARPVAFEAPSAGFLLDWSMLQAIRQRGARFATLTHAAGISSTGDVDLDRRLPLDEPYEIPSSTADLVGLTRAGGGRIIAIGTTVVRALEAASVGKGLVRPGPGLATNRLGPASRLAIVDAIVSGMHEPGTSHYQLLEAFAGESVLEQMTTEAEERGYLAHEYGDFVYVERAERTEATGTEETGRNGRRGRRERFHKRGNGENGDERGLVFTYS